MPGPQLAEGVAAGGQLADELGEGAVQGVGSGAQVGGEVVGDMLPVGLQRRAVPGTADPDAIASGSVAADAGAAE